MSAKPDDIPSEEADERTQRIAKWLESAQNPQPVRELVPLMNDHTLYVCTSVVAIDRGLEKVARAWTTS